MDANELSELLEDVREYMKYVGTGDNASVLETIKNVARENTAACSAIGHIIEQYLLKADPAHKIGALLCIDIIVQRIKEPYVTYFSANIAKMFAETWKSSGDLSRRRMQKWVAYYEKHNVYPPQVVAQIRAAIDPDGSHKAATAKQADPRQRRQSQPSSAGTVLAHAPPARLDMPQRTVQVPQQFMHNAAMNGTVMPPRPPGGALMPGTMPPAPALGTSFAGIRLQVPRVEALQFLSECTRKIYVHLNDKRIARERAKREGKAAKSRQWFPASDMWLKGTAAVESAAPVQEREVKKEVKQVQKMYVVKDETQTACAISGEPFTETWDDELQDWVYEDAVRIPPNLDVPDLPNGAIVKVALLGDPICAKIREMTGDNRKRKNGEGETNRFKRVKRERDSDDDD